MTLGPNYLRSNDYCINCLRGFVHYSESFLAEWTLTPSSWFLFHLSCSYVLDICKFKIRNNRRRPTYLRTGRTSDKLLVFYAQKRASLARGTGTIVDPLLAAELRPERRQERQHQERKPLKSSISLSFNALRWTSPFPGFSHREKNNVGGKK